LYKAGDLEERATDRPDRLAVSKKMKKEKIMSPITTKDGTQIYY